MINSWDKVDQNPQNRKRNRPAAVSPVLQHARSDLTPCRGLCVRARASSGVRLHVRVRLRLFACARFVLHNRACNGATHPCRHQRHRRAPECGAIGMLESLLRPLVRNVLSGYLHRGTRITRRWPCWRRRAETRLRSKKPWRGPGMVGSGSSPSCATRFCVRTRKRALPVTVLPSVTVPCCPVAAVAVATTSA